MKKKIIYVGIILIMILVIGLVIYVNNTREHTEYFIGIGQLGEIKEANLIREGFIEGLRQEGLIEGENLRIDYQNASFDNATVNLIANKFISEDVDLAMGITTPVAQAILNAASGTDIPIVFTGVANPKTAGLTSGNITGVSDGYSIKQQLDLAKEILPNAKRIGIIYTTSEIDSVNALADAKAIINNYGFEIIEKGITTSADIPLALDSIIKKVDCIINPADNVVTDTLPTIIQKANENNVPVIGMTKEQVKVGCISAPGVSYHELGVKGGKIAAGILKGEVKASDIPYQIVDELELYVNSKVFELLGIELSAELKAKTIDVEWSDE